ncbi:hypothetical protein MRX96_054537 [Rhipicephalus microplus]
MDGSGSGTTKHVCESARGESSDPAPIRMIDGAIARAIRSTFGASRHGCQRAVKTLGGGPSVARLAAARVVTVPVAPPLLSVRRDVTDRYAAANG